MAYQYKIKERDGTEYIEIIGRDEATSLINIPSKLEGLSVRVIGEHAFASDQAVETVRIPDTVDTILGFAFHNCGCLSEINLTRHVTESGDGAVRMCDALREVVVDCRNAAGRAAFRKEPEGALSAAPGFQVVRAFLSDIEHGITFRLLFPDGEARLFFPGYLYDFRENTMARKIQFSIAGSGMAFRECVGKKEIDFREYDRLFDRARAEDAAITMEIAFSRLMAPYHLSENAKTSYEAWLAEAADAILAALIAADDAVRLRFLLKRIRVPRETVQSALEKAAAMKRTGLAALLMETLHDTQPPPGGTVLSL